MWGGGGINSLQIEGMSVEKVYNIGGWDGAGNRCSFFREVYSFFEGLVFLSGGECSALG